MIIVVWLENRSMAARFLEDDKSKKINKVEEKMSKLDVQDDGYFATYDHYEIHKEMLQVDRKWNLARKETNLFFSNFFSGRCSNWKLFERDQEKRRFISGQNRSWRRLWNRNSFYGLSSLRSRKNGHRRRHVRYNLRRHGDRQVRKGIRFQMKNNLIWWTFQRKQYRWNETRFSSRKNRRRDFARWESSIDRDKTTVSIAFLLFSFFKVDIIISEWMGIRQLNKRFSTSFSIEFLLSGYFLLFECMLESVIFARNHYLAENGLGSLFFCQPLRYFSMI